MSTNKTYLIQGVFFERIERMGRATVPGEGVVATIGIGQSNALFSGVLTEDRHGNFNGVMVDRYGPSDVLAVVMTEDHLDFTKRYRGSGRDDVISYEMYRQGEIWVGSFEVLLEGAVQHEGVANCIVAPAPMALFEYPVLDHV